MLHSVVVKEKREYRQMGKGGGKFGGTEEARARPQLKDVNLACAVDNTVASDQQDRHLLSWLVDKANF